MSNTKPGEILVTAPTEGEALEEALERFGVEEEAIEYEVSTESDEELLEGAKPEIELRAWIRPEYIADQAADRLGDMFDIMGLEFDISTDPGDHIVRVDIEADDASLLIGRDGQNLDAFQYLVNRMIVSRVREAPMLLIDIQGYRRKELDPLEDLVERAISRARESGNEIELDSMPPLTRKYLHNYLRQYRDIKTFSRGQEPDRYLVIVSEDESED